MGVITEARGMHRVCGVQPSSHPCLENNKFAARFGEMPQCQCGRKLEESGRMSPSASDLAERLQASRGRFPRDLDPIDTDALSKINEMRGSV